MAVVFVGAVATISGGTGYNRLAAVSTQLPPQPAFRTISELVVLHVVIKDRKGAYVAGLQADDFTILEDGRQQTIQFFGSQDTPVTVGLLIDNSGSMLPVRDRVIAAAGAFVQTSNPADEIFALVFNEVVRSALPPGAPFTNNPEVLREALRARISARGRTAMHDAILAGLAYLAKGTHQRQVLIVVSDGGDNASTASFDQVLAKIQISNTVVYAIGLIDLLDRDANPGRLKRLAEATGGEVSLPSDMSEVESAMRGIAQDIRSAYTIGYVPTNTVHDGRFRRVRVMVVGRSGRFHKPDLRFLGRRQAHAGMENEHRVGLGAIGTYDLHDLATGVRVTMRKMYLPAGSTTPGTATGALNVKNVRLSNGCAERSPL